MEKSTKVVPLNRADWENGFHWSTKVVPLNRADWENGFYCIARRSQETKSVDLIKTLVTVYLMIYFISLFCFNLTVNINVQLFCSFIGVRLYSTRVLIPPFGSFPMLHYKLEM